MSDSTANAREPSMEDILASIRRIIDEEDSRDGRPATDLSFDVGEEERDGDADAVTMPVSAPVQGDRDAGLSDGEDSGHDAIFPERESPFWSRATGRNAETAEENAVETATALADGMDDAEDDIYTRAQNKLDHTDRPSARERMQNLAARAKEAASAKDEQADDDTLDLRVQADAERAPDNEAEANYDNAFEASDAAILDLTAPIDLPDADKDDDARARQGEDDRISADTGEVEEAVSEAEEKAEAYAQGTAAELSDAYMAHDEKADTDASFREEEETTSSQAAADAESSERRDDAAYDDQDDVLDLTTPLEAQPVTVEQGSVESGDGFQVSAVEPDEPQESRAEIASESAESAEDSGYDIEADISQRLAADGMSVSGQGEANSIPAYAEADDAPVPPVTDDEETGLYSRFDNAMADAAHEEEAETAAVAEMTSADDASGREDEEHGYQPQDDDAAPGAFTSEREDDRETPASDEEADEGLDFPDTFSASDVYHDDPPELGDDYSRSFDNEDAGAAERAGFADMPREQDDMETVGGMVRDAMDRDPVDYADPAALVSMTSEEISARALASLADIEGEAGRRVYGALRISDDGESESLEGMVRGMLKPMLREWLDDNLPSIVESTVRGEVERISARSRKYSRAADND